MKTIINKLSTGVVTSFKDKGGNIKVKSPYCKGDYNVPLTELELSNNVKLLKWIGKN